MTRYATGWWAEDELPLAPNHRLSIDVYEHRAPVFTGLVTADGRPIMRLPDTVPMGFHPGRAVG